LGPPPYLGHVDWPLGVLSKKCKVRSKGVVMGSREILLEFWDPFHISGTVEARYVKFGTRLGHWGPNLYNAKLGQKGS